MFNAIRWRLTAWYVAILALILLIAGIGTYLAASRFVLRDQDEDLRLAAGHTARTVAQALARHELEEAGHGEANNDPLDAEDDGEIDQGRGQVKEEEEDEDLEPGEPLAISLVWTYVITEEGQAVRNAPAWLKTFPHPPSLRQVREGGSPLYSTVQERGETVRLYTEPVVLGGRVAALVQTGKPITPALATLREFLLILALAGAAGLTLAAIGGLFLAGRALVPIREAFRRQREFVADASHELRTPLSILRASAEVLDRELPAAAPKGEGRSPAVQELIDNLVSETSRMGRLIGDLFTLARADSGDLELDLQRLDLAALAEGVVRRINLLAKEKNVNLEAALPARLPVEGDPARLEQLLLILLDNAVKYTPAGGKVTMSVEARSPLAEIRVADTGIGIPAADLPRIFDRFYRVDKARSRDQGGTGLGLSIARWIAEAHHGTIRVESEPGRGTVFTASIPLQQKGHSRSS